MWREQTVHVHIVGDVSRSPQKKLGWHTGYQPNWKKKLITKTWNELKHVIWSNIRVHIFGDVSRSPQKSWVDSWNINLTKKEGSFYKPHYQRTNHLSVQDHQGYPIWMQRRCGFWALWIRDYVVKTTYVIEALGKEAQRNPKRISIIDVQPRVECLRLQEEAPKSGQKQ